MPQVDPHPFVWFAKGGRGALVGRLRRRIGARLGQSLDPEDLLQESLLKALQVSGGEWSDSRAALGSFLSKVAELRVKHEGRKAGVQRAQPLTEEAPDRSSANAEGPEPPRGLLGAKLRPEHRWSLFLQDWMEAPWPTARLLLERPTDGAARSLHQRARAELVERIRD